METGHQACGSILCIQVLFIASLPGECFGVSVTCFGTSSICLLIYISNLVRVTIKYSVKYLNT